MTNRSIDVQELDGPRLVRREEFPASHRLDKVCFGALVEDVEDEKLIAGYKPPRRGGVQVICHRGVPVSQICTFHSQVDVYGSPLRIGSIGGVCTHPDYRGLGLATRVLEYCARQLVDEGARLMLISGTRGLYTRAGYVTAQDLEYIVLKPHQLRTTVDNVSLRPTTEADAALCARIYQAEPVHFVRRVEEFTEHFSRGEEFPKAEDWIVEVADRPAAYIITAIPWEYVGQQNIRVRKIFEYAGSRVGLVGALARLMGQMQMRELRLPVPWQDVDFLQLLRAQGVVGDRIPLLEHTMRIVDFPGLMSDLRPYVRARLTARQRRGLRFEQVGDRYNVARGRERLELDGAAMTRLVMGVPSEVEVISDAPVLSGALGEIVSALFPLPSFLPGLNYR